MNHFKWGAPPLIQSFASGEIASMASEGTTGIPVFGRRRQSIPKPSLILIPSCVLCQMDCLQDLLKRRNAKGTSKVLSTHRAIIRERNRASERRAWRGMNEIKIYFSQVSECHTDTSYFVQMLGEGKNKRRGNVWGYFSKRITCKGRENGHRTIFLSFKTVLNWLSIYPCSKYTVMSFRW